MAYFFLAPLLPPLELCKRPEMALDELFFYIEANLSSRGKKKVAAIQSLFDLENIRSFWMNRPFSQWGNLDEKALEETIISSENPFFPLREFLEDYGTIEERLRHFDRLVASFFAKWCKESSGFLKRYFDFEYKMRLFLGVLRSKTKGDDLLEVLQNEPADDPFIEGFLRQRDSIEIVAPEGWENVKTLYDTLYLKPLELQYALLAFKMGYYQNEVVFSPLSEEAILSYVARFFLVEKSLELDAAIGKNQLEILLRGNV